MPSLPPALPFSLQPGFGLEPADFPLPRVSSQALGAGREQLGGGTKVLHQFVLPLSAWAGCLPTHQTILCRSLSFGAEQQSRAALGGRGTAPSCCSVPQQLGCGHAGSSPSCQGSLALPPELAEEAFVLETAVNQRRLLPRRLCGSLLQYGTGEAMLAPRRSAPAAGLPARPGRALSGERPRSRLSHLSSV